MRIVLGILLGIVSVAVLYLLVLWISSLFVDKGKTYRDYNAYYRWLINSIAWISIVFGRVKLCGEGLDAIKMEDPVLYVCNHRSNYDPVIMEWLLRRQKNTFVTKPENFNIFVVGQIARRNCCIPIDRGNVKHAIAAINSAIDLLQKEGFSISVFPEGTRSRNGELLPFHNGVFKIAKKTGVPIVAYYLDGTDKIAKNTPWKKTKVYVRVATVIESNQVKNMTTTQIGMMIRDAYLRIQGEGRA